jgi:hypothetical protein
VKRPGHSYAADRSDRWGMALFGSSLRGLLDGRYAAGG